MSFQELYKWDMLGYGSDSGGTELSKHGSRVLSYEENEIGECLRMCFYSDNMSSSQELNTKLSKYREEFNMSESDRGSARIQDINTDPSLTSLIHLFSTSSSSPPPQNNTDSTSQSPRRQQQQHQQQNPPSQNKLYLAPLRKPTNTNPLPYVKLRENLHYFKKSDEEKTNLRSLVSEMKDGEKKTNSRIGGLSSKEDLKESLRKIKKSDENEEKANLKSLQSEVKNEEKPVLSFKELNERSMKLTEIEKKETESRTGGVTFKNLHKTKKSDEEKDKMSSIQRPNPSGQSCVIPTEHLVEKCFHPDNMSVAEKLKTKPSKDREKIKMSESDHGYLRVQDHYMDYKNKSTETEVVRRRRWTNEQVNILLDFLIRGTMAGKRNGDGWGEKGWLWVYNEVKAANLNFTNEQLKWKWYEMKRKWKLVTGREIGISWNSIKGTVDVSHKRQKAKIKETEQFANLLGKRIGQKLYNKYALLFMDSTATGEHVYTPGDVLPDANQLKVCEEKRTERNLPSLCNRVEEVEDGEKSNYMMCRVLEDQFSCSISEIMGDVVSLPGMIVGSQLHFFSTLVLDQKSRREMYVTLGDAHTKLNWLKYCHELWSNGTWKPGGSW